MDKIYSFYFGPAAPDFGTEDTYFQDEKGNHFYYKIVVEEEGLYIYDTCHRMMPLDREFVQSFGTAMFGVSSLYKASDDAAQLFSKRLNEIKQLLDHFAAEDRQ